MNIEQPKYLKELEKGNIWLKWLVILVIWYGGKVQYFLKFYRTDLCYLAELNKLC